MWTWDSTEITHDQTCWTYDGSNECDVKTGGRQFDNPFMKFLTNAELEALSQDSDLLSAQRIKEDDEMTEFIVTTITRGLI